MSQINFLQSIMTEEEKIILRGRLRAAVVIAEEKYEELSNAACAKHRTGEISYIELLKLLKKIHKQSSVEIMSAWLEFKSKFGE